MRKYIWLIRHGESQGNLEQRIQGWADYPLTDQGRHQAAQLAERLALAVCAHGSRTEHPQRESEDEWRECPIQELVASPLQRAAETAYIIGDALGLPVRFDARLREYNFGPLSGLTASEITARFPTVRAAWQANRLWQPLPGEEGEPAFVARVRAAMDEVLVRMFENTGLIVVAHGGSLDACLRSWLGLIHRDGPESSDLYGASGNGYGRRTFAFDNTSLSLVRVQTHSYRLLLLNDTCHLRGTHSE
jgi:broad specificity phosphatase PhoE